MFSLSCSCCPIVSVIMFFSHSVCYLALVLFSLFLVLPCSSVIVCYLVIISCSWCVILLITLSLCHYSTLVILFLSHSVIVFLFSRSHSYLVLVILFLCHSLCCLVSCDHVFITNWTSCWCFYSSGLWVPYPSRSAEGKWAQNVLARSSMCWYPACFLSSSTHPKKSEEVSAQLGTSRFCLPPAKETKCLILQHLQNVLYDHFYWSSVIELNFSFTSSVAHFKYVSDKQHLCF